MPRVPIPSSPVRPLKDIVQEALAARPIRRRGRWTPILQQVQPLIDNGWTCQAIAELLVENRQVPAAQQKQLLWALQRFTRRQS